MSESLAADPGEHLSDGWEPDHRSPTPSPSGGRVQPPGPGAAPDPERRALLVRGRRGRRTPGFWPEGRHRRLAGRAGPARPRTSSRPTGPPSPDPRDRRGSEPRRRAGPAAEHWWPEAGLEFPDLRTVVVHMIVETGRTPAISTLSESCSTAASTWSSEATEGEDMDQPAAEDALRRLERFVGAWTMRAAADTWEGEGTATFEWHPDRAHLAAARHRRPSRRPEHAGGDRLRRREGHATPSSTPTSAASAASTT